MDPLFLLLLLLLLLLCRAINPSLTGQNGNLFVTLWNPNSPPGLSLLPGNTTLLGGAALSEASDEFLSAS